MSLSDATTGPGSSGGADADRERRIELLTRQLPSRMQPLVRWLRRPTSRLARICIAVLLMLGGLLWFLPVLGLWMLPLGLVLLSEDVHLLRRTTNRMLAWIEDRRPHWLGLARARER